MKMMTNGGMQMERIIYMFPDGWIFGIWNKAPDESLKIKTKPPPGGRAIKKERRIVMGNLIETIMNTLDCEYDEIAQNLYSAFEEE